VCVKYVDLGVIVLGFPFTDPPTPLSIKGAEVLAAKLDALP